MKVVYKKKVRIERTVKFLIKLINSAKDENNDVFEEFDGVNMRLVYCATKRFLMSVYDLAHHNISDINFLFNLGFFRAKGLKYARITTSSVCEVDSDGKVHKTKSPAVEVIFMTQASFDSWKVERYREKGIKHGQSNSV